MSKQRREDIAVIGMACLYPGAKSPLELWENILAKRQQFRKMPDERLPLAEYYDADAKTPDKTYGQEAALIDGFQFDWSDYRIPKKTFESTDIVHWLALHVALQALEDAGYDKDSIARENSGVILGNTLTGEWTRSNAMRSRWPFVEKVLRQTAEARGINDEAMQEFLKTAESAFKSVFPATTEDTLSGALSNTIAGRICNFLDLNGGGFTVDGACSSSLIAVIQAARSLANHELDLAFAGGIDISLDTFELIGFAKTGALSRDEMRVYDKRASGFIPGEGCGFVLLKRLADAKRDGDKIYAVLKGWSLSSDGKGGLTAPSVKGQAKAIGQAYDLAAYQLNDCHFVEGHGTGTPLGDRVEISALAKVLESGQQKEKLGLTSLKSIIGHTKAAAGIGALIKAIIAVNRRVLPPFAGCEIPNELFQTEAQSLYPLIHGEKLEGAEKIRAGVSAMGFGGINSHVTLESGDIIAENLNPELAETALMASYEKFEAFPFSAASSSELLSKLQEASNIAARLSRAELLDYAADLARYVKSTDSWKAAVIAEKPADLCQRLEELISLVKADLAVGSVKFGERIFLSRKKSLKGVAFVFPGQASQNINMGRQLLQRHDWAKDTAQVFEKTIREVSDKSFFATYQLANPHRFTEDELKNIIKEASATEVAQPAICLVSALWHQKLKLLGIIPNTVAGHSLGELTALWAAGALNTEELASLSAWRGKYMADSAEVPGKMAMIAANAEQVSQLIARLDSYITIANLNGPQQTIVAGEATAIEQIIRVCQEDGIHARELNVSNAFHSKLMDNAAANFANKLDAYKERNLSIAVVSGINNELLSGSLNLGDYLPKQIVSQVNYMGTVSKLKESHELIIEVGPGKVLSNINKSLLADTPSYSFAVDDGSESGLELKKLISASFCLGIRVKWDQLYAERLVRPFVAVDKLQFIENPCERPLNIETGHSLNILPASTFVKTTAPQTRIVENPVAEAREIEKQVVVHAEPNSAVSIETIIIDEVHELTGFDKSTIHMELRILDDLNMDSIKAGELISNIAMKLGLAGEGEFGDYFNASLGEIAAKFQELGAGLAVGGTAPVQAASVHPAQPVEAVVVEDKPVLKPEPTQTANKPKNILSRHIKKPWVRSMVEVLKERPASEAKVEWQKQKIAIVYDSHYENEAYSLAEALEQVGGKLNLQLISDEQVKSHLSQNAYEHILVLLQTASEKLDQSMTHSLVDKLYQFTKIGRSPQGTILSFVQFSESAFGREPSSEGFEFSIKSWLASLSSERPDLRIRAYCIDPVWRQRANELLAIIGSEGARAANFLMTYVDSGKRLYDIKLELAEAKDFKPSLVQLGAQDVVFVAGGAKGITAVCAFELAKEYGCKMALVGSSALDKQDQNSEIMQTLKSYQEAGLNAAYYQCNLLEVADLQQCINQIEGELGSISAVIYGAGINKPCPASLSSKEQGYKEVDIKILAAYQLYSALSANNLKLFASLTSVIGVTGMPGNTWYALANESLDLLTRGIKARSPSTHTVSIAYSVWSDIGMGAKLGSVDRLEEKGISPIPTGEGVERFMQAIKAVAPDHQQVIVSRMGDLRDKSAILQFSRDLRFTDEIIAHEHMVESITKVQLTAENDPYLLDHDFKGTYLFPTVFGLEAMAQNVMLVTSCQDFEDLIIEDISLAKPITVGKQGTVINIWTEVLERHSEQEPLVVRAGIRCEKTGFKVDHFSASFKFTPINKENFIGFDLTSRPLGIDPTSDLYNKILFQGPRFQQLKEIYHLESDDENEGMTIFHSNYSHRHEMTLVLGDPYFRDSLLQSAQLIIPRYQCLPIDIQSLRITKQSLQDKTKRYSMTEVHRVDDKRFKATITVVNEHGEVLEVMENYSLQLINHVPEHPRAAELIDRGKANMMNLRANLRNLPEDLQDCLPSLLVIPKDANSQEFYYRELRQFCKHHKITLPESLPRLGLGEQLIHCGNERVFVSISDTDKEYMCSLSKEEFRTVDLQVLDEDWQPRHQGYELFRQLQRSEALQALKDSKTDQARLDGIVTLLIKSDFTGNVQVEVQYVNQNALILKIEDQGRIITLLSCLVLNGKDRIYTIQLAGEGSANEKLLEPYRKISEVLRIEAEPYGPQDQSVFVHSFIPDFKAFSNLGRSIYFSHFFNWMGSARELSSVPVLDRIRELTETGRWGLVTNWASIKVLGECRNKDRVVQARMWCGRVMGTQGSSVTLAFDWVSRGPDGIEERIATGYMGFTWVEILGHGIVKPAPFPDYYREFIDSMIAKNDEPDRYLPAAEPLADLNPGAAIFVAKKGPNSQPILFEKSFETSLFDANLVGNLYFGNYSIWMGKTRDFFFQKIMPNRFVGVGEQGEFRCTDCKIQHLREAMPFDNIRVTMSLTALYEEGMDLYFEFYKVNSDGKDEKLAYGDHRIVWTMAENSTVEARPLPEELMNHLAQVLNLDTIKGAS